MMQNVPESFEGNLIKYESAKLWPMSLKFSNHHLYDIMLLVNWKSNSLIGKEKQNSLAEMYTCHDLDGQKSTKSKFLYGL